MSATAVASDNAKSGRLNVVTVREDLSRAYCPSGALELMLVTQLSQTWVRLQEAYETESRYRATRDMLEVITTKLAEFKAVQSYVRDCERAWNHAKQDLEKAQRKRQRETAATPAARKEQSQRTPSAITVTPTLPTQCAVPAASASASKRE